MKRNWKAGVCAALCSAMVFTGIGPVLTPYLENAVGCTVKVKRFVRFETGEGLEKKQEDFAAEVAAQMNA